MLLFHRLTVNPHLLSFRQEIFSLHFHLFIIFYSYPRDISPSQSYFIILCWNVKWMFIFRGNLSTSASHPSHFKVGYLASPSLNSTWHVIPSTRLSKRRKHASSLQSSCWFSPLCLECFALSYALFYASTDPSNPVPNNASSIQSFFRLQEEPHTFSPELPLDARQKGESSPNTT